MKILSLTLGETSPPPPPSTLRRMNSLNQTQITMRPSYCLKAESDAVFETSYGVPTGEKGSPKTQQHQVSALALGCSSKLYFRF
jgi:hypothetical protein